ncbi:MAG TPA: PTS glucose transporter subunit IIA [Actinotalea sp.]|nr:PTS glucose transporter subunit IIA [Actinotalea sp.]
MSSGALTVRAPFAGTVRGLSDVPDPVFADRMLGPGLALDPQRRERVDVRAPVDGTLASLHPHAFVIAADDTRGVLVHLGLDTVELAGTGFAALRAVGDEVRAGDLLLRWDPVAVAAAGHSLLCPVIAIQADSVQLLVTPGEGVAEGQALLLWP